MDIVATSLEALIQRATSPQNPGPDKAAVDAFCGMVNKEPDSAHIAARLIITRIQSPQEWEALQGLNVLEACMKRCGSSFHAEVGKFRFLNEMIKLVSPKYLGAQTPTPVRQRVLQLMYSWTVEHPREAKIKEAYQMLRKQGVIKDDPPVESTLPAPSPAQDGSSRPGGRSSVFEDEKKQRLLQKLLQSKNPEDLQAANRLIKTMVKEDERRVEMMSKRASELEAASNNARLLSEMLDCYRPGSSSGEDLDLIKELHQSCERFSLQITRDVKPEETLFGDVMETTEELNKVFAKYQQVIVQGHPVSTLPPSNPSKTPVPTQNAASLLDLSTPSEENLPPPVQLVNNQLADLGLDINTPPDPPKSSQSDLDALGDIFGAAASAGARQSPPLPASGSAVLQPVLITPGLPLGLNLNTSVNNVDEKPGVVRALEDLDALGESLLKQSLPSTCRPGSQFNKTAVKVPMNQLGKVPDFHTSTAVPPATSAPASEGASGGCSERPQSSPLDLDFLIGSCLSPSPKSIQTEKSISLKEDELLNGDDAMVDLSDDGVGVGDAENAPITSEIKPVVLSTAPNGSVKDSSVLGVQRTSSSSSVTGSNAVDSPVKTMEVKPLTDISVSLNSIKPGPIPPLTALDERNGISVVLHLAKDTPRPDVSVYVVSTISKNSSPLTNYVFQAVVPKTCKLRLLPASNSELPAHNPFLPPAAITQVMLVANPAKVPVNLKFMVSYTMEDETVTEMGEVESLPMLN